MVVADTYTVYEGAIVEIQASTGKIRPAVDSTICMGIAAEYGAAGDTVRVEYGHIEVLPFDGTATVKNNGKPLYGTADDIVAASGNNTIVGKQVDVVDDETLSNENTLVYVDVCLNN
jgi:hypothetical protein